MRTPVVLVGVLIIAVLAGIWLTTGNDGPAPPLRDYLAVHTVGEAFVAGRNPYDPVPLLEAQRRLADDPEQAFALMIWNPPYVLPLLAPTATLPPRIAQKAWKLSQFVMIIVATAMLVRVYRLAFLPGLAAFAALALFSPTFLLMLYSQTSGIIYLGLAGFLFELDRDKPMRAGAYAALMAFKPHMLFAVGLVILLDAIIVPRLRKVVLGGVLTCATGIVIAWLTNPMVVTHYIHTLGQPSAGPYESVTDVVPPVLGYWLRQLVPGSPFAVQLVPTAVMSLAVIGLWLRHRRPLVWPRIAPLLVIASCIAAAYGAWLFDLIILMVPVVAAIAVMAAQPIERPQIIAIGLFIVLNILSSFGPIILASRFGIGLGMQVFIYFTPAIAGLLWLARRSPRIIP
jgi:hypothetical protein